MTPNTVGVGAGKILGVRRIFAGILPTLPEKKTPKKVKSHLEKKSSPRHFGRLFFKLKHVGRRFCSYFQGVHEGFRDFARIFTKSKLLGVSLHSPHPHLLRHCLTRLTYRQTNKNSVSSFNRTVQEARNNTGEDSSLIVHRVQNHWLGSWKLPFSTVYHRGKVEGTFRLKIPPVLLGYDVDVQVKISFSVREKVSFEN